jgi:uncharacterized coiled-coil DUF342 family protein
MEESKESKEERPKHKITLDTEIPPMPSKAERLPAPDEDRYEREMKSLEGKIGRLRDKKKGVNNQIKLKKEGGKVEDKDQTVKDFIGSKVASRKEMALARNKLRDEMDALRHEFHTLVEEQKKVRPKIKIYDKEKTEKQIYAIQARIETTTLTLQEEKKLISELSELQQSVALITPFLERNKKIDEIKARQDVVKAQITEYTGLIDQTNAVIDETHSKVKNSREKLDSELPLMFEETKKIQDEIDALEVERQQLFEAHRDKKREYQKQQNFIKNIEWMTKMKQRLVEQEERRKQQEEEEKQRELNKPHPYAEEILSCDAFIAYLKKFVPKETKENAKEEKNVTGTEFLPERSELNAKEAEAWFGSGQKKQKKKRSKKTKTTEALLTTLPVDLLNFFSYIGLKVPTNGDEAKAAIEELEKKKSYWEGLESREKEEERRRREDMRDNKSADLSLNPVNFPAPEDSKVQEKYGIFKDEGPVPVAKEENTRGKRGKRRFK